MIANYKLFNYNHSEIFPSKNSVILLSAAVSIGGLCHKHTRVVLPLLYASNLSLLALQFPYLLPQPHILPLSVLQFLLKGDEVLLEDIILIFELVVFSLQLLDHVLALAL